MTRYKQRQDGEGFVVPRDEIFRLACCDCGLVHDIVISYDKETGELGMATRRNNRATAQRRRKAKVQGVIMATKNDITGDLIQTRTVTQTYRDNYDLIFGNKNGRKDEKKTDETEPESVEDSPSQE